MNSQTCVESLMLHFTFINISSTEFIASVTTSLLRLMLSFFFLSLFFSFPLHIVNTGSSIPLTSLSLSVSFCVSLSLSLSLPLFLSLSLPLTCCLLFQCPVPFVPLYALLSSSHQAACKIFSQITIYPAGHVEISFQFNDEHQLCGYHAC